MRERVSSVGSEQYFKGSRGFKSPFLASPRLQELEAKFKADGGGFERFALNKLFSVERGTRFVKQRRQKGTLPLATAGALNQGIAEFVAPDAMMKEYENHLTIDMFCNCFYRGYKFICDDNILVLFARDDLKFNEKSLLYVATIINLSNYKFDFSRQYRKKDFNEHIISLPVNKNRQIAFKFMEDYIAELEAERVRELEAERVRELEAYLAASKLKDYALNADEKAALKAFENSHRGGGIESSVIWHSQTLEWKEFKLSELFDASNGDFDIQQKHINGKGEIVVSSGETNMGIIGKSDVMASIFKAHTITTDMFGSVFYRNHKYKMVTHARVFSLEFKDANFNPECMLYVSAAMKWLKFKFSFANMASWKKIKDLSITLPVHKNGCIAFEFMQVFIQAVQKEVIKNVVLYTDKKLAAYALVIK